MELIVISSPDTVVNEIMIINHLFQLGLKCFHIRKPYSSIETIRELLNEIEARFYDRISLHQYHEMASEFGFKRLHYTELARMQLNAQDWQGQLDKGFTLSTSIHDTTMLPSLEHVDYVFYGPVFNSISKPGYQSKLSADFKLDKKNIQPKVIALGGVEATSLIKIKSMGFDGVAVLGAIWNKPDQAIERFNQLKENLPV